MNRTRIRRDPICEIERRWSSRAERRAILRRALDLPLRDPGALLSLPGRGRELDLPEELRPRRPPPLTRLRRQRRARGAGAASWRRCRASRCRCCAPELHDFDVVYSAHVSPYGAVPATLHEQPRHRSPRSSSLYPTAEQQAAADRDRAQLRPGRQLERGSRPTAASMAASSSTAPRGGAGGDRARRGRTLPELDQPAVLERVRAQLEPELELEEFIHACVECGGIKPLPSSKATRITQMLPSIGRPCGQTLTARTASCSHSLP